MDAGTLVLILLAATVVGGLTATTIARRVRARDRRGAEPVAPPPVVDAEPR